MLVIMLSDVISLADATCTNIDHVRSKGKKEMNEWISVKKELPRHFVSVLVTWKRGGMARHVICIGYCNREDYDPIWLECGSHRIIKPMYWMPLLEYPKKKK